MVLKCNIGVLPSPGSAPFQYNSVIQTHNNRSSLFIYTPIGSSEDTPTCTYRTLCYRGTCTWKYIYKNVSTDVSYVCFKYLVKTHIEATFNI